MWPILLDDAQWRDRHVDHLAVPLHMTTRLLPAYHLAALDVRRYVPCHVDLLVWDDASRGHVPPIHYTVCL